MVTNSSSLCAIGGFTWSLTSRPRGISRGVRKLTWTSTVIRNNRNENDTNVFSNFRVFINTRKWEVSSDKLEVPFYFLLFGCLENVAF